MLMIIALLLLALCIGLLLGRKATLILICVIYAMGHWGSAKAATDADIDRDIKIMERSGNFHIEDVVNGSINQRLATIDVIMRVLNTKADGAGQILATDLLIKGKARTLQVARKKAQVVCNTGYTLVKGGVSVTEAEREGGLNNTAAKDFLEICFTAAFLEKLQVELGE